MPQDEATRQNRQRAWARVAVGLIVLASASLAQVAAQGPLVLDGVGDDWNPTWQVAADPLDVSLTTSSLHPHEAPTYARSGYDAIALWAHYQAGDDRWYFRIDTDGRAGDSDSQVGTAGNLGVGTHGPDGGPLVDPAFMDGAGLGTSEVYKLSFQYTEGGSGLTTELGPGTGILPGVLSATSGNLAGQGIYGTTVPGVVEFAVDRATLFPEGPAYRQLWISGQVGDAGDMVSDDPVHAVWLLGLDFVVLCPAAPAVDGDQATFPLQYAIPADAALGVSDVVVHVALPPGTTFVSASNGGLEVGSVIIWSLGDLAPGDAGQLTFTLEVTGSSLTIDSDITCAEGLRYLASNVCPVLQPTNTPVPVMPTRTPTPPGTSPSAPPVVPEPATWTLVLAGLSTLAGYAGWQIRRRRRQ